MQFKDALPKQDVNLWNFWEAKMQHENSKKALYAANAPNECLKWGSNNKVKEYDDFAKSLSTISKIVEV